METPHAMRAGSGRAAGAMRAGPAPWFQIRLSIGYCVNVAGTWGTGETCRISRGAVEFVPAEPSIRVGDALDYVLVFPGHAGKPGAVASCRGQVVRAGAVVVVTIDNYRLQTAIDAKAPHRDQWTRQLVAACEAARHGRSGTAHVLPA
ncbi:MAG: hypothetical protein ACM3H9_11005 [Rhodospirillaceae bacterium]